MTCATATPSLIRERYQPVDRLPRRVSGYNLDELLPERGFNVARALVGTESTCATVLQVKLKLTPALLHRTLVVVEYDELPDAAEHCIEIIEWKPIGLEALDHRLIENQSGLGQARVRPQGAPQARSCPRRLADGAVRRRHARRVRGRLPSASENGWSSKKSYEPERIKVMSSTQEGGHSGRPLGGPRGRTRLDRLSARRQRPLARLGGLGCPAGARSATTCATSWRSTTSTAITARSTATSARAASTRGSTSTCAPRRGSASTAPSWRRRRTSCCPTEARCRASTATDSSAPSCSPSSTARSCWKRCASSSASGIRTGR